MKTKKEDCYCSDLEVGLNGEIEESDISAHEITHDVRSEDDADDDGYRDKKFQEEIPCKAVIRILSSLDPFEM